MKKAVRRRKVNVDPSGTLFTDHYSTGPIITLIDSDSDWVNDKPTKSVVIKLDNEYNAIALLEEVRKAVAYHRKKRYQEWKNLDDSLKATS